MEPGREGGTWLALGSKNGVTKIGALLNITGEKRNPNAIGKYLFTFIFFIYFFSNFFL